MDFKCVECGDHIAIEEIFGAISNPHCPTCWEKLWKGHEEEYLLHYLKEESSAPTSSHIKEKSEIAMPIS